MRNFALIAAGTIGALLIAGFAGAWLSTHPIGFLPDRGAIPVHSVPSKNGAPGQSARDKVSASFGPGYRMALDNQSDDSITDVELQGEFTPEHPRCTDDGCKSSWMFPFAHASEFVQDNSSMAPLEPVKPKHEVIAEFDSRSFAGGYEEVWKNKCVFDVVLKSSAYHEAIFPNQNLCAPARLTVRNDLWKESSSEPHAAAAPEASASEPKSTSAATIASAADSSSMPQETEHWTRAFDDVHYIPQYLSGPVGVHVEAQLDFTKMAAIMDSGGVHFKSVSAEDLPPGFNVLSNATVTGTPREKGYWKVQVTLHGITGTSWSPSSATFELGIDVH